jgi:hypothetical protein
MLFDRDMWIQPVDQGRGAVDFADADVGRRVDHLPLQVGERHDVVVDDAERADTGGRKIKQYGRAKAAGADHKNARAPQRRLSGSAHFAQHDVACITL